jgi:hypothetical protein
MDSRSPQQRRRIAVTPKGAAPGGEVTVTVSNMPPMLNIKVGFGSLQEYQFIGRQATDGDGGFVEKMTIPDWAQRNKVHYFFVAYDDESPRGVSEPFHVTARDGTATVAGQLTTEGRSCRAMKNALDVVYTLVGDTSAWPAGAKVVVTGTIVDGAPCGDQGITLGVTDVKASV